ncbi:hypothetical protein [Porphyromonas macacae]|uniref:hypothetical protein n=1 Tax=Porphyromonas macacae TaxID=28115 RepID=UPI0024AC9FD7|nr:hypothetical protein [Porphyromonas macacae]
MPKVQGAETEGSIPKYMSEVECRRERSHLRMMIHRPVLMGFLVDVSDNRKRDENSLPDGSKSFA